MIAVPSPRNPHKMFNAVGVGAKAVMREQRKRNSSPAIIWIFRPKRSAVRPKKSMKEPEARPRDAAIQVICAGVIIRSRPMVAVFMFITPWMNVCSFMSVIYCQRCVNGNRV